jgi:hypothetical protein
MTVEDKLQTQLDNKKNYEDWQILQAIEGLPNVQTLEIVKIIREKYTKNIVYLSEKRPKFLKDIISLFNPLVFFDNEWIYYPGQRVTEV